MPRTSARSTIHPTDTTPRYDSVASVSAWTHATDWAMMSIFRLSTRSAMKPAYSDRKRMGTLVAALTAPSQASESVSSRTSQPIAVTCSQVPLSESRCPT